MRYYLKNQKQIEKLEAEIVHFKQTIKYLRKGYGKDKCKGYLPGCPNCDYQVARGWLWQHLSLLEWELKEKKKV